MKKVLLDTNFIIDSHKFKVSLEEISEILQEQVELFILSTSIKELEKIGKGKSKASNFANLALKTIKLKKIKVLETEESPDKAFLNLANKNTIIATNDSRLRKKLKEKGIKTIYLRGKKELEVG